MGLEKNPEKSIKDLIRSVFSQKYPKQKRGFFDNMYAWLEKARAREFLI